MYPNLRAEMARKGLTALEFAKLLDMPYNSLTNKLRGDRPFTYKETLRIKEALGVDVPLEILFSEEAV